MRIIHFLRQHYLVLRQRYLVTLGAWLAAGLVTLKAGAWADRTAFALWLGAILVGAFFEGRRGGLAATGLAVACLLGQYQLIPADSPKLGAVDFLLSLALLTGVGVLTAYLSGECRGAVRTARQCQDTLARLPDALLLLNGQGRVTYLNEPAEALIGRPAKEALGEPVDKVLPLVNEESRQPIKDLMNPSESPVTGTALLTNRGGTEHVIEYRIETLGAPGAAIRLLTVRDISARRAQEQDLRQREQDLQKLRRRLTDQEQLAETLRQQQREQEGRSTELENVRSDLQKQLDAERAATASLRRDHAHHQDTWKQTEEGLQQRLAELTGAQELLRQQLAEHQAAAEALRREHAHQQDAWKKVEETQQQRLAELARAQEFLQGQLSERRGIEEALRGEQAANLETWKRLEESLHGQIAALTDANRDLQSQLTERQAGMDDLQRRLAEHVESRQQLEATHAADRQQLQQQLDERQAASESLRREMSALAAAKIEVEQEAAALRQREAELRRELERAGAEQQQAAEERRRLEADHCAREAAFEEQAGLLHTDLRAAEDSLERTADRLRPLLARARAVALAVTSGSEEDEGLRPAIEEMDRQVQRGLVVLDAIRTAHHLRRGDLPVHKERVEAHAIIDRALASCGAGLRRQVTVALPLGPEWIVGDPDLLSQALAIVLDQAADATEPGGDIRLEMERQADAVLLRVENDGRDIPAEELALARGLVELHGGRFSTQGNAFVLQLPVCPPPNTTEIENDGTALKVIPFRPELGGLSTDDTDGTDKSALAV